MTDPRQPDGRGFTRVGVRLDIALEAGGAEPLEGRIRNVSASGLFIETGPGAAPPVTADSECRVVLTLGDDGGPVIRALARVVRVERDGVALRITEVDGQDSFVHLRNLVLYNAEDADAAVAEFDAHAGLKPWE